MGNWVQLGKKIIQAYSTDIMGITDASCARVGVSARQCRVLKKVLPTGHDGLVTSQEREELARSGFSEATISTIAGTDGKRALLNRVKWLGEEVRGKYMDNKDKSHALFELGDMKEDALPALFDMVAVLRDPDPNLRVAAVENIGCMGPAAGVVFRQVFRLMDDPDWLVRDTVLATLGRMGPAAREAIPRIVTQLENPSSGTRRDAIAAIQRIGTDDEKEASVIIEKLKKIAVSDENVLARAEATELLIRLLKS